MQAFIWTASGCHNVSTFSGVICMLWTKNIPKLQMRWATLYMRKSAFRQSSLRARWTKDRGISRWLHNSYEGISQSTSLSVSIPLFWCTLQWGHLPPISVLMQQKLFVHGFGDLLRIKTPYNSYHTLFIQIFGTNVRDKWQHSKKIQPVSRSMFLL